MNNTHNDRERDQNWDERRARLDEWKGQMNTETEKKRYWWHWVIERCANPECNWMAQGQSPVRDEYGEDCLLFEKVEEWKRNLAENPRQCSCGKRVIVTYRHASADHPNAYAELQAEDEAEKRFDAVVKLIAVND